jgi:hypothetical protein
MRQPIPFSPKFNEPILRGEKDVTRRFRPRHVGTLLRAKNPVPGKKPNQWPGFADLIVVDCRSVRLQDLTDVEAYREGVQTVEEFRDIWRELYGPTGPRSWDRNPGVWRIQFHLTKQTKLIEQEGSP